METLLVTGHRGLLGSACIRQLKHKYRILTTERNLTDDNWVRYWFAENKPDYVIHCAAKVGGVKANRDNPVSFLVDNLTVQNIVIQAAADYGVKKLVFIGTSCLYPKNAPIPVNESTLMTGPFEHEVEAYATAKLAGYQLCNAYRSQYGKNFVTVCPSNLYGVGDKYGPTSHVIPSLIKKFHDAKRDKTPVHIWGNGKAVREFMCSDDAARAIGVVLEKYNSPELINIGTGESTTINHLAYLIGEVMNFRPQIVWDQSEPIGIPEKTFDISKLKSLGWAAQIDLHSGLSATVNDFLTNPHLRHG